MLILLSSTGATRINKKIRDTCSCCNGVKYKKWLEFEGSSKTIGGSITANCCSLRYPCNSLLKPSLVVVSSCCDQISKLAMELSDPISWQNLSPLQLWMTGVVNSPQSADHLVNTAGLPDWDWEQQMPVWQQGIQYRGDLQQLSGLWLWDMAGRDRTAAEDR